MPEPPEEHQEATGERPEQTRFERFALSPSVQEAVREIPSLIRENMQNNAAIAKAHLEFQAAAAGRATKWILIVTVVLALVVVIPTSILTWLGKLSADAATFLFGAIVGAAFTFLRDFFPRSS